MVFKHTPGRIQLHRSSIVPNSIQGISLNNISHQTQTTPHTQTEHNTPHRVQTTSRPPTVQLDAQTGDSESGERAHPSEAHRERVRRADPVQAHHGDADGRDGRARDGACSEDGERNPPVDRLPRVPRRPGVAAAYHAVECERDGGERSAGNKGAEGDSAETGAREDGVELCGAGEEERADGEEDDAGDEADGGAPEEDEEGEVGEVTSRPLVRASGAGGRRDSSGVVLDLSRRMYEISAWHLGYNRRETVQGSLRGLSLKMVYAAGCSG